MAIEVTLKDIQVRRDNAAGWTSTNPILLDGEIGFERDGNKIKIGNGVDQWTALNYLEGTGGSGGGFTQEEIEDLIDRLIVAGDGLIEVYDDASATASYTLSIQPSYISILDNITSTLDIDLDVVRTKTDNLPNNQNVINSDIESRVSINDDKVSAGDSIGVHSDVDLNNIGDGQVLKWNATNSRFEPAADNVGGGGAGATQLSELTDVSSASVANGNVIIANGTSYLGRLLLSSDISDIQSTITNNNAVVANTSKRTYPSVDETKLSTIELNAKDDQLSSEVPYSGNGQSTVEGALNNLYSIKANDSGLAKVANSNVFTNTNTFTQTLLLDKSFQIKPSTAAGGTGYAEIYFDINNKWNFESTLSSGIFGSLDFSALTGGQSLIFTDTDITWNGTSLTASAGGLSANNQNKINNENRFKTLVLTSNGNVDATNLEETSGTDIGKKIRNVVNGTTQVEMTILSSSIPVDELVVFETDTTTSRIDIIPAPGQTFIGKDLDNTNTIARLQNGIKTVVAYRINSSTVKITGDFEAVPEVNQVLTISNAASDPAGNESNSTTGWSAPNPNTLITSDTDSDTGTYAIKIEATGGGNSVYGQISFSAIAGDTFTVSWRSRSTQGPNAFATAWQNCTGGPSFDSATSTWTTETYNITATNTGNVDLRFYAGSSNATVTGDNYFVDNLSVIKTN